MNKISGIYEIRNLSNSNCYIGSSVNIANRYLQHKNELRKNNHHSEHLQRAWNKYGEKSFVFKLLLICDPETRFIFEQKAIDRLKPDYNEAKNAKAPTSGLPRSEETKRKISLAMMGNKNGEGHRLNSLSRQKISVARLGMKFSEEHCKNIGLSKKGIKQSEEHVEKRIKILIGNKHTLGHKHTRETKEKMSESHKRYWEKMREQRSITC